MPHEPFEFDHSNAKRVVLASYLKVWLIILGAALRKHDPPKELVACYFDGFAATGLSEDGEPGSPLVALEASRSVMEDAPYPVPIRGVCHVFCEAMPRRAEKLAENIERWCAAHGGSFALPESADGVGDHVRRGGSTPGLSVVVWRGSYDGALPGVLAAVPDRSARPLFCFLDPTGWSDVPFDTMRGLLSRRWAEVLLTFMSGPLSRFATDHEKWASVTRTFGDPHWRPGDWDIMAEQYTQRLRGIREDTRVCAYRVRHSKTGAGIYHLLHAAHHCEATIQIKEHMWKQSPPDVLQPEYGGRDHAALTAQLALFAQPEGAFKPVVRDYLSRSGPVPYSQLRLDVLCETTYNERHLRNVLRALEEEKIITVESSRDRKRRGFQKDDVISITAD